MQDDETVRAAVQVAVQSERIAGLAQRVERIEGLLRWLILGVSTSVLNALMDIVINRR